MTLSKAEQAELLEKAADVIRVNGWHRGSLWPGSETVSDPSNGNNWRAANNWKEGLPVCLIGSLRVAAGLIKPVGNTGRCDLSPIIEPMHQRLGQYLHIWNDAPERTADEVIELLLTTAKDRRNEL